MFVRSRFFPSWGLAAALIFVGFGTLTQAPAGAAATASVGLGTADNVAVLAGQGVTNTGPTTVSGDLGTSPNPTVTGAGLTVVNGTIHSADAVAARAQADVGAAYDDAAGRPASRIVTELNGQLLTPGAYDTADGTLALSGTVTLDAQGDTDAVFILQADSTLITASNSNVALVNGANPCRVFWQVGSSATLGTTSTFRGTILALTSITVTTGVTVEGRILARNGAVTLDTDTITRAACTTPDTTSTTLASETNPSAAGAGVTLTSTVTPSGGGTPSGTVQFLDGDVVLGNVPLQLGQATFVTPGLAPGNHALTAIYLGSPGFRSSTSSTRTQTVTPAVTPPGATEGTTTLPAPVPTEAPPTGGTPPTSGAETSTSTSRATPKPMLPATGTTTTSAVVALVLIVAGAAMVLGTRRPRRGQHFAG